MPFGRCAVYFSVLAATFLTVPASPAPAAELLIGKRIDNFTLLDSHSHRRSLTELANRKVIVLVFLGAECPLVKLYVPRLNELAQQYEPQGVTVLGVDSNAQDRPSEIATFARTCNLGFPILRDTGNAVADQLGATRTPEVVVLDQDRAIRYRGRIDDANGVGRKRTKAARRDLNEALEELLAGKPVSQPETQAAGCLIGRVRKIEPHGDVTYSRQISRILNRRCVECHREKELAPFALTNYDDVVGWADTICEVVKQGRMPPWFAAPEHGRFSNDCSLTDEEKKQLDTWVENGCPRGDAADLPEPPKFVRGWRIGKPDAVYKMKEPYRVAAEGTENYKYFTIDPDLKEDVWVSMAEARPGNPAVVHHIVLFTVPPGVKLRSEEEAQALGQNLAVYAPGMPPWKYPDGMAARVKAGSKFIIQMHYTPNGTAQDDLSYVGLKFADAAKVKKRVQYGMAINSGFQIPPHADNYEVVSRVSFSRDMLLLNLFPHMHYRGKSFRFEAIYPDETREVLLDVPHYDFNWQLRYDLVEPKLLPKGTTLLCTGHFDNSEANVYNPDPNKAVRFGLQTWEEMQVGYYTIAWADEDLTQPKTK